MNNFTAMHNHQPSIEHCPEEGPALAPAPSKIVCGTDFSESAAQVVEVAATLAKRIGEPLVLVHAVNDQPQENLPGALRDSLSLYARARLHEEEERIRGLEMKMTTVLRAGAPETVLLEEAAANQARLLVLAAAKRHSFSRWLLDDVAVRVAEASHRPTLVVRDPLPLLRWARGERRLRVCVCADFSAPSEAALRWVDWLQHIGECDVVAAYLESSIPPMVDTVLFPSILVDDIAAQTARIQERHFRQRVRKLLGRSRVRVRCDRDWGRSDAHLIQLAGEERADLIVVGTHSRHGWQRLGHHSVSRGVLHYAPLNVVCVPAPASASREGFPGQDLH